MSNDYLTAAIDVESAERLAAEGLRLGLVDTTDRAQFAAWLRSEARGFHEPQPSEEAIAEQTAGVAYRRTTGVWDPSAADAASPIATVSVWPTELTVPGETSVTSWAISAVTVAPTHRRRGIARALLEAELRTANRLGVPVAILTVSEATIYSRYGFAPTAMAADLSIDTQRAAWRGPAASGRVHFISLEQLHEEGLALVDRARAKSSGQIGQHGYLWDRMVGLAGDKEAAKKLRAVRYDDASGEPQGFAIYRIVESTSSFSMSTLELRYLVSVTDDAYAGLWRFLLEVDLVSTVTASLRAVDEPVLWQVSDFRAVRKTAERDHLWARILDVKTALEARRYSAPGRIILDVSDPLAFADGLFLIEIDAEGRAGVTPLVGEAPDDAAALSLTVNELAALYLGGVTAVALVRAGRITELRPGSADAVDASFRSSVAPWLDVWF